MGDLRFGVLLLFWFSFSLFLLLLLLLLLLHLFQKRMDVVTLASAIETEDVNSPTFRKKLKGLEEVKFYLLETRSPPFFSHSSHFPSHFPSLTSSSRPLRITGLSTRKSTSPPRNCQRIAKVWPHGSLPLILSGLRNIVPPLCGP